MKKMTGLTVVLLVVFALAVIPVCAQDQSNFASGGVRLEGLKTFGNDAIGGFSYVNSGAGFTILPGGDCRRLEAAEGIADAKGTLNAGGNVGPNSLSLNSSARTLSSASQLQGGQGQVYVDGLAQRANWGGLNLGSSFISGWDSSRAEYYGTFSGPSPSALGKASTDGSINLSITPNSTAGSIRDNSQALVRGTPGAADPSVQGSAGLTAGTRVSGAHFSAIAQTDTQAAYSAADPRSVSGGIVINSNTNITQNADGSVSLKATTGAKSFTKTGPTNR